MIKAALVAGLLASSTNARAEDPATEAKQHVDRASELHKAGKLDDALLELKTAYALDPRPQLLFAMGQIHVQLGQCPQAIVYYERFLATKPRTDLADVTKQAIEACKTNPPPVETPPPEPTPTPTPTPSPTPPPTTPTMQVSKSPSVRPWYTDVLGDSLVAGGVASGVIAVIAWRGAVSDRDDAVNAGSYEQFDSLIDSSQTKQKVAIGFGIGAGALITAGVLRLVLHDRTQAGSDIAIAPAPGGATLHWARQF